METSKITIRAASEYDAEVLLNIYAPYIRETAITFEYDIPTVEEFAERIRHTLNRYPYLVAECEGEIVGYAYASSFHERAAYDWAAETSIYVSMDKKRLGIGVKLYEVLEKMLKKQGILNLNACIACPIENDPYLTRDSVAFHEKMGYRIVGHFSKCGYKFNRWYDMVWMEKHIGEHKENQPAVRKFPDICK